MGYADIKQMNTQAGQKDLALFNKWKESGDIADKRAVLNALMPVIAGDVNKYSGSGIHTHNITMKAKALAFKALDKYDPAPVGVKATKLSTFIKGQIQPIYRFVNQNKDSVRVPEHIGMERRSFIDTYYNIKDKEGLDPSVDALSKKLSWSKNKVNKFMSTMLAEETDEASFMGSMEDLENEDIDLKNVIQKYVFTLPKNEKDIFVDMTGFGTITPMNNTSMQNKYRITINQVSNFKRKFRKDIDSLLHHSGYSAEGTKGPKVSKRMTSLTDYRNLKVAAILCDEDDPNANI